MSDLSSPNGRRAQGRRRPARRGPRRPAHDRTGLVPPRSGDAEHRLGRGRRRVPARTDRDGARRHAAAPLRRLPAPAAPAHRRPRLRVPPERYAQVVALASCAVVGGVCALVFVLSRDVVRPWPFRLVLAAVPVVLPLAPYEISGNAANLHWFLLVLVPWVFTFRSRSWWGAGALAVVAGVAVLTEPLTALFAPLLLLAWTPRGRTPGSSGRWSALPVTVVVVVALAAQGVTALTNPRALATGSPAVGDVLAGYLLRPVAGAWGPDLGAALTAVVEHGWAVVLVPAALLLVVLVAAVVVGPTGTRWMVTALAAGSVAVWWVAVLANHGAGVRWSAPVSAMAALPPQRLRPPLPACCS
ncbi:hypothetical protein Q9Q99_05840 [Curtobacterium flaccumfaciens]|nr:hypothetical protein Q9Q99_05840 [Curtobacterium flaccumfaciens]